MKILKFEDMIAWQKAKELAKSVYGLTSKGDFAKDFALKDQVRRAAISPMSNIAERASRQTDKEFIQFLYIALGSIGELRSQLYLARELNYITDKKADDVFKQTKEVARLINGLIKYLRTNTR